MFIQKRAQLSHLLSRLSGQPSWHWSHHCRSWCHIVLLCSGFCQWHSGTEVSQEINIDVEATCNSRRLWYGHKWADCAPGSAQLVQNWLHLQLLHRGTCLLSLLAERRSIKKQLSFSDSSWTTPYFNSRSLDVQRGGPRVPVRPKAQEETERKFQGHSVQRTTGSVLRASGEGPGGWAEGGGNRRYFVWGVCRGEWAWSAPEKLSPVCLPLD